MFLNNGELEATPENTWIVMYPNDIMDGIIIDLDDQYAFISAHTPGYAELLDELDKEGVETVCVAEDNDLSQPPHSWIINSIARLVVHEAEMVIDEPQP